MRTPAPQSPKLDLSYIDESHHQESAPTNRTHCRNQVPDPESVLVDVTHVKSEDHEAASLARGFGDPDGLFEAQSNKAGEEEGAEGVDMEADEILRDLWASYAFWIIDETIARVGGLPS